MFVCSDGEEGEKEPEATEEEEEEGPREMTLEEYNQKHSAVSVKCYLSVLVVQSVGVGGGREGADLFQMWGGH